MNSLKRVVVVLGAVVLAGQIYAQPANPPPAGTPAERLTIAEMQSRATTFESQAQADHQQVLHLQATARKEKDVIKLSCVNDKMVALKAELNILDADKAELASIDESTAAAAMFTKVAATASRIHDLREEANGCAGQPEIDSEYQTDSTTPIIPDDPTTGLPFGEDGIITEPPGYASPFN